MIILQLILSHIIAFIIGGFIAQRFPKQWEIFRAYTANEEPRELD